MKARCRAHYFDGYQVSNCKCICASWLINTYATPAAENQITVLPNICAHLGVNFLYIKAKAEQTACRSGWAQKEKRIVHSSRIPNIMMHSTIYSFLKGLIVCCKRSHTHIKVNIHLSNSGFLVNSCPTKSEHKLLLPNLKAWAHLKTDWLT